MATRGKQATTANSPPRQEYSFAPRTPPTKSRTLVPRKKPNNGFIRDVDKKVNSPVTRAVTHTRVPITKKRILPPAKSFSQAAAALEEAEGAILPKQDQSTQTETVEPDAHGPTTSPPLQDDKPVWEGDEFVLLSLEHKAAEKLYKRPKSDEINEAITVNVFRIEESLKDLSMNTEMVHTPDTVINQGLLIADSVSLLKLKTSSSKFTEMAGQKAQRAATLMLQAQMMSDKAKELLAESKDLLRLQAYKNGEFSA